MTLEEAGVSGHVSNYIDSDYVVERRPSDRVHVVVYRIPGDDTQFVEGGSAHDVVLREAEDETGTREIIESWRSFGSAEDACVQALDLAETHDSPIWDDIIRLSSEPQGGGSDLETATSDKADWDEETFPSHREAAFGNPDPEAWTETMTVRERVRAVVELMDEPKGVKEVASRADVGQREAERELARLVEAGVVEIVGDRYRVNRDRLLAEDVQRLLDDRGREELEEELRSMEAEVDELREEFGVDSADDLPVSEENVVSTWRALESDIQLYRRALQRFDEGRG